MTNKDVEQFKNLIPKKIEEILDREKIGESDIVEIKIDVSWNIYNEPIITTTEKAIHTEVIELTKAESEESKCTNVQ